MRIVTTLITLLITHSCFSQSKMEGTTPNEYGNKKAVSSYSRAHLGLSDLENKVADYLKKTNHNLTNNKITLVLDTSIESLTGWHFTYHQNYDDIEIYNSQIKVNTDKNGTITSLFDYSFSTDLINQNIFPNTLIIEYQTNKHQLVKEYQLIYLFKNNTLIPSALITYMKDENTPFEIAIDNNGDIIYKKDLNLYFDSLVTGTVFLPDPLTKAGVSYGIPYVDNNDNDVPQLNAERDTVSFNTDFNSTTGEFTLASDAVLITEHSIPTISPVTSTTPEFHYSRSESGFEDVNAFYHINTMQNHIQTLGFNNIANYQIHIDTHGHNDQDQSSFTGSTSPPKISFGEGGVDDAEDADVILHEYGHAIMHSAVGGSQSGSERATLDEAIGDYFAVSYSRFLSENSWDLVFTWDAHNDFWGGRMASSTKHYPEDLSSQLYASTDIWASTIMQIWEDLGRDATDQLMLESAYGYSSGMTMVDAATLFYQADVDLNGGANFFSICNRFQARGLMSACPNGINKHKVVLDIELLNSQSFAKGTGGAIIRLNRLEETRMNIYSTNGQLIQTSVHNSPELAISPTLFKSGIYLVEVLGESRSNTFKLVKY
jgi:hypothetical protein